MPGQGKLKKERKKQEGSTKVPKEMRMAARRMLRMKEYNLAKVALLFNVNRSTLRDAIARTEKEIERSVDNRGRPAALTDADVLTIKRLARDWGLGGEYFTTKDLKVHLELDCSEATIAKALKQPGEIEFTWKKRVRKPCMSEHDCAVRLMFFLEMQKNWFKKVHGFIDQSEFDIPLTQKVPRTCWGWMQLGKELQPQNVAPCPTFNAPKAFFLLMWKGGETEEDCKVLSCIGYEKMTGLTAFNIIKTHYYPALLRQYGEINGPYLLQTDGCGSIAKGVQDFNALMGREAIRILFRGRGENDPYAPGRLCDFWPTESIWAYVKDKLPKAVSQHSYWKKGVGYSCDQRWPKGKRQMRAWRNFVRPLIVKVPKKTLFHIYKSIPKRRDQIIGNNGGNSGY